MEKEERQERLLESMFIMILMPDFMLFIIDMSGVSKLSSFILKPFRYTGNEDT
jgi:hypothetical protein